MLDLTTTLTDRLAAVRRTAVPALTLAVCVGLLAGCSRDADDTTPDATSTPSGSTAPSASTTPDGADPDADEDGPDADSGGTPTGPVTPEEVADVEDSTEDFYDDHTIALGEPKETPKPADYPHVTGQALEDLFNEIAEFQNNGWRMVGEPEIVRQRVVRRTKNPDGVVVRACVDNSAVRVHDRFGDEVPNSRPSTPRTLNVLTLVRKGGSWVVTEQRLARDPDC